jgi:hypothetical protein
MICQIPVEIYKEIVAQPVVTAPDQQAGMVPLRSRKHGYALIGQVIEILIGINIRKWSQRYTIWPAKLIIFAFYLFLGFMKFKKGDRVSFLNDIGGGVVNRIDERGMVYVLTEDGFEIPVMERELVFSRNFAATESENETVQQKVVEKPREKERAVAPRPEAQPVIPGNLPDNAPVHVLVGFIPDAPGPVFNSNIACYLINDSAYFLYYMVGKKEGGSMTYLSSGYVEAETKNLVASFDQTALSKISDIHIQLLFISKGRYSRKEPVDALLSLRPVNFSKESYYRGNDYFEEKAVLFNLSGLENAQPASLSIPDEVKDMKRQADLSQPAKPKKKEIAPDTLEVDLHFDEVSMQNSQFSPSAILALQMSRFHAAIEEAISKNLKRIVFIHGLGQGTLKVQIRKELQEKYPQFIYQDASFKEYGFGATMVHLSYNKQ